MVTRVDKYLGGLGIDATGKLEVTDNAAVVVGDGSTTGNVYAGTINSGGVELRANDYATLLSARSNDFNTYSVVLGGLTGANTAIVNLQTGLTGTNTNLSGNVAIFNGAFTGSNTRLSGAEANVIALQGGLSGANTVDVNQTTGMVGTNTNLSSNVAIFTGAFTGSNTRLAGAESNVIALQGGISGTNTNLSGNVAIFTGAFTGTNTNLSGNVAIFTGAFTGTNTNLSGNVAIFTGAFTGSNTRLSGAESNVIALQGGLAGANTAIVNLQTGLTGTNTNLSGNVAIFNGAFTGSNTRLSGAESNVIALQGGLSGANTLNGTQTTNINNLTTGLTGANTAIAAITSSPVIFQSNVTILGNLTLSGNTTIVTSNTISFGDTLLSLGANNTVSDNLDIGLYGHYWNGTANSHSGIFRSAVSKDWMLFANYTIDLEGNSTVTISNSSFQLGTLRVANANAGFNVSAANAILGTSVYSGAVELRANDYATYLMALGGLTGANTNITNLTTGLTGANTNITNLTSGLTGANTNITTLTGGLAGANTAIALRALAASPTFTGNATFDTNTLFVDSLNDRVGIGTVSPGYLLDVRGTANVGALTTSGTVTLGSNTNVKITGGTNGQVLATDGSGNLSYVGVLTAASPTFTGNATFDTNTLFVDSVNDRVGLITTLPGFTLDVRGTANTGALTSTTVSSGGVELRANDYATYLMALGGLTGANTNITALTGGLTGANTNITALTGGLTGANTNITALTGGLTGANTNITALTGGLTGANTNITALTGGLTGANTAIALRALAASPTFTGNATFDTNTLFVDSLNDRVGIGTASPTLGKLQVVNSADSTAAYFHMSKNDAGSSEGVTILDDRGFSGVNSGKTLVVRTRNDGLNDTGAISSFETIGGSTINALWVGISGNVGIGTASPGYLLDVRGSANVGALTTSGTVTLGSNTNVKITGGSANQYLQTDGSGNLSYVTVQGVPVASIIMYGANTAPSGWLTCDGTAVSRSTYSGLFAVVSNVFGIGDNSTTFNLPDFRGRSPYGVDASQSITIGAKSVGKIDASYQNSTGTGTTGGSTSGTGTTGTSTTAITATTSNGSTTVASTTSTGTSGTGTGTIPAATYSTGSGTGTIPAATYSTGTGTTGGSTSGTGTTGVGTTGTGTSGSGGPTTHTLTTIAYQLPVLVKDQSPNNLVSGVTDHTAHTHTIPGLAVPGLSVPGLSIPGLSIPALSIPAMNVSVPGLSIPAMNVAVPGLSIPALTIPSLTVNTHTHNVPALTIPGLSIPGLSIPGLSVPALTVTHPATIVQFIIKT